MKTDLDKLQGTWTVVSLELDEQPVSVSGARIVIEGDRFTSLGMGAAYEGVVKLDASATPRTFDLKFASGPEKGNTNLGIYELKGNTWRICLATRGRVRPKKFATKAGSGIALEVLKRGGGVEVAAPKFDDVQFEPVPELAGEWVMVSGIMSGEAFEKSLVKSGRRVVDGHQTSVYFGPQLYAKAKFTVDRSQKPMAMDYYHLEGAHAGKVQRGIYELAGDTLKLCFAAPGKERPADFAPKPGDGRTLTVWQRG